MTTTAIINFFYYSKNKNREINAAGWIILITYSSGPPQNTINNLSVSLHINFHIKHSLLVLKALNGLTPGFISKTTFFTVSQCGAVFSPCDTNKNF